MSETKWNNFVMNLEIALEAIHGIKNWLGVCRMIFNLHQCRLVLLGRKIYACFGVYTRV
jgi:hypothetical protein